MWYHFAALYQEYKINKKSIQFKSYEYMFQ
jgi:hypothetical protein